MGAVGNCCHCRRAWVAGLCRPARACSCSCPPTLLPALLPAGGGGGLQVGLARSVKSAGWLECEVSQTQILQEAVAGGAAEGSVGGCLQH